MNIFVSTIVSVQEQQILGTVQHTATDTGIKDRIIRSIIGIISMCNINFIFFSNIQMEMEMKNTLGVSFLFISSKIE